MAVWRIKDYDLFWMCHNQGEQNAKIPYLEKLRAAMKGVSYFNKVIVFKQYIIQKRGLKYIVLSL
jgi:hypothetical protein